MVYPAGVTARLIAADPDIARPQWVVPERFWDELEKMLAVNAKVGENDATMADRRARSSRCASPLRRGRRCSTSSAQADAALHTSAKYEQVGVEAGGGWQRQENGGLWGTDWFGRAQAAVVYILVNDYHEAVYPVPRYRRERRAARQRASLHPGHSRRTRCRVDRARRDSGR